MGVTPHKDATAIDYIPDGTGRDTYITKSFGLKRNYKSSFREFEKSLRDHTDTPVMDSRVNRNSPFKPEATIYTNWPSPTAVKENKKIIDRQQTSVDRLSGSPSRTSPMSKYLNQTSTFDVNP